MKIIKSYLKNDKFAFENSQEVAGLLSHDHSDLNWGSIVLVINIDSLEGACCNLIACGMASLKLKRKEVYTLKVLVSFPEAGGSGERGSMDWFDTDLPHVEYVLLLACSFI